MIKIEVCIGKEDAKKKTRNQDFNIVADFGRREFMRRTNGANESFGVLSVPTCISKESSTCVRRNIQRGRRETTDVQ